MPAYGSRRTGQAEEARPWVVFDVMGVIFEEGDDDRLLLTPFVRRQNPHMEPAAIRSAYLEASLGRITSEDFWRRVGLADRYPQVERTYLDSCLRLSGKIIEIVNCLSRDFSLAILSNDVREWSAYLRAHHGLDRFFQQAVVSGEAGCRKPNREIYTILLDRLAAPAGQCLFLDDREENLIPAAEMGMHTVLYQPRGAADPPGAFRRIRRLEELPDVAEEIFSARVLQKEG